jgi:uncharacterized protein involved in outer membrane biogenesis
MVTARRLGRWALYGLGGLLVLVVVLRVGLAAYLHTSAGRAMVAHKISEQIGMPVEVTAVRVGMLTSSIGLRVFDPAAPDPDKAEVLVVENASADVSLFGLAAGNVAPSWVNLNGVTLTLHVAADGTVITTMPKAPQGAGAGRIPAVTLTGGRITIRQDGRPEFAVANLGLTLTPAGNEVKLAGTIDDPKWAKWTVSGNLDRSAKTGWVELASTDAPLTMERLTSVPFVPPVVWERVRADGRGAAVVRVWSSTSGSVEYSVDIRPAAAALTLPDASVTLQHVTGLIRVSGAKVTLTGTRAELAGGTIAVDGELDFGAEPTTVTLKVSGEGLDIRQLPEDWKLPKDFEGKMKGHADLVLKIYPDGHVEPDGGGEGMITDVIVLGFPADDIPIHLRKAGRRYEFHTPATHTQSRGARPHELIQVAIALSRHQPEGLAQPGPGQQPGYVAAITPQPFGLRRIAMSQPFGLMTVLLTEPVAIQQPPAQPKKDDEPTTLDATIRLRDIEVSELLDRLKVNLGYKISGKVSVEASMAVPVGRVASAAAYQFGGKVSSPALTFEGLTVRDVSAKMTYQNGKFTLTDLSGKIDQPGKADAAPGTFKGTASAAVNPPGDAGANLTFDRIPLGEVLRALPDFTADVRGTVSGKAGVKVPFEKRNEATAWSGSAYLTSGELVVEGRTAKDVHFAAEVAKGVLALKDAGLSLEGIPVTGEGTLGLTGKYPFSATVRTTGTSITDLRKLVPEVEIPAPVEGVLETESRVEGTASPFTFTATGQVTASKLTLARSTANHISMKWQVTTEKLTVSELKAEVFGGSVTGSADVPFDREKTGSFNVGFKDVDAGAASELVPDFPVRITGKVSGKVAGAIPAARPGESRVGNLDVDLTAPKLTVQGVPAERLVGKAAIKNKAVEYALEGKALGGSFEIKGRYPGQKKEKDKGGGGRDRGSFRLTGLDLSRIAPEVGFQTLAPLHGRVDASFDFENDLSAGSGRVAVTGLRWGNQLIAREVTGMLILREGVLELAEVNGRVAGGELRARATVRLNEPTRNFFSVSLNGVDAKRLLAPVTDAAGLIDGPLTVVVRGRLGREVRASGTLSLPRGTVAGAQVSDLRVPFEVSSAPGGYGRLTVHEAAANAGSGRARADVTVDWGFETRVDGLIQFTDVPLRTVVPALEENALFGNGRITGRFTLAGKHMRSIDDLTGTLVARLNNTSVKEIPILRQVTPFLNPSGLVKPFQAGDVRGTLAGGVFRVQRLTLANPAAQLFAEGTITTTGRIDLDVVAHTGAIGPEVRALQLFGLGLPLVGPVPLTLIRDVSDFLSNRTIRLTITGTTSNPIVRVNVGALLTDEAVRFFLSRYIVPADAATVLGLSSGFGSMKR